MEAKLFIFAAVAISEVFSACKPSNIKFSNFWKLPKRRVPFAIGATAQKCPGINEFYYEWVVEEYPALKVVQTSTTITLFIDGYTYDSNVCFNTDYRVTVKISHYPDMSFSDETTEIFRFTPDDMHIEIIGGLRTIHQLGEPLTVDAKTLSKDTSYPPEEDAFVGNVIEWRIRPNITGYNPPAELVIKIPAELLKENQVYVFTINVTRNKIKDFETTKTAEQFVRIVSVDGPQLTIKCVRNCLMPHNLVSTALAIECTKNCENLEHKWTVTPPPPPGFIQFGNGYEKIIINGGAYKAGDKIFVSFIHHQFRHTISLTYASGMDKGNCTINPAKGISAVSKFTLKCEGFSSPYGLSVVMVFQKKDISGVDVLLSEYSFAEETEIYIAPGDPANLLVYVEDHAYLSSTVMLNVTVKQFVPVEDILVQSAIKILTLSRSSNSITSYSLEGLNNEVVELVSCLLDAIDYYNLDEATTRDLHKHMAQAICQARSVRMSSALQYLLILWKLHNKLLKTDSITMKLISQVLLNTVLDVHELYVHKHTFVIPFYNIQLIFNYVLALCANLLKKNTLMENILNHEVPPHDYDSYDEFVSKKIQIRDSYRKTATDVIIALQTASITILAFAIPDENAYEYRSDQLIIILQRILLLNFGDQMVSLPLSKLFSNGSGTYLPPEFVRNLRKKYTYIDYQFVIFLSNPFWWHRKASTLNTKPVLFDLFFHCEKLRTFPTPFFVHLEIVSMPRIEIIQTLSGEDVVAYKVELKPKSTLVVEFFNAGENREDFLVTWSDCFCTKQDFSSKKKQVISKNVDNETNIMRIKNDDENRLIFLCIKKSTPVLKFRLMLATFSCLSWNNFEEKWNKDGCEVVEPHINSNNNIMVCQCYHSSVIVGEISAPPTTMIDELKIDFSITFFKNNVMMAFISGLLLLWLVSLALAHLKDKSMKKNNVVYKLDDNVPGDSNPYLVVVFTGIFYDAQTTADVAFRLVGKLSHSRTHLIKCQGTTLLKRNSQDWFIIYSPSYLGQITKIKIWHNCKGRYPHWYCDRVIVQDMKIGEQYCFTVKKWFSVIWGTGKVYREIHLKSSSTRIRDIFFRTQLEKAIKDKHIWLSVVTRDIQSNFNSKERVSTGFCFLFLSMLANALLLGFPQGSPSDSIDQQSSFYVNPSNVFIFFASWIMATFFSFLIIYIFKNSAPL